MNAIERIKNVTLKNLVVVHDVNDIPKETYMVYILIANGEAIVVGHGRRNRAKVICDNIDVITNGHIKALKVRLYHLYSECQYQKIIIPCDGKKEANELEKELHSAIGGNATSLPVDISESALRVVEGDEISQLLLKLAMESSFDGIYDLKRWRRKGVIQDEQWSLISRSLRLNE